MPTMTSQRGVPLDRAPRDVRDFLYSELHRAAGLVDFHADREGFKAGLARARAALRNDSYALHLLLQSVQPGSRAANPPPPTRGSRPAFSQ